ETHGGQCAGIAVSLCADVQRLVWRTQARLACTDALSSGFQLLFHTAEQFVGDRDAWDTARSNFCAGRPFCCVADRRAKKRSRSAAGERTASAPDRREYPGGLL